MTWLKTAGQHYEQTEVSVRHLFLSKRLIKVMKKLLIVQPFRKGFQKQKDGQTDLSQHALRMKCSAAHCNQCTTWSKSVSTSITAVPQVHALASTYVNAVTIVQSASMQIFASSFNA